MTTAVAQSCPQTMGGRSCAMLVALLLGLAVIGGSVALCSAALESMSHDLAQHLAGLAEEIAP